jgi:hypothetical protein
VESKKSTPDPVANTMDFTTDPKTQSVLTETRNILATAAPEADLIDVFRGAIQTIKTSDIKLKKRAGLFGIYCYTIIPLKEMRDVDLISGVMNFLARKLCVNPIIINSYDTSTCKDSLDLELNGRIKSVLIAEFSFYYLMREVEKMWADLKKGKGLKDNSSKADFQKILLASFEAPFDFDKISYFEPENPGLEKYVKAHHIAITQRTRIRLPVDDDDE